MRTLSEIKTEILLNRQAAKQLRPMLNANCARYRADRQLLSQINRKGQEGADARRHLFRALNMTRARIGRLIKDIEYILKVIERLKAEYIETAGTLAARPSGKSLYLID